MYNALNNGKEHVIDIITMGRQYALYNCWAYFCKGKNVLAFAFNFAKLNDWFKQLSFYDVGMLYPISIFLYYCFVFV
jgi:hypothetical protein